MARVRLILEDDAGNPLPAAGSTQPVEHLYSLEGSCDTLDQIEAAVESFRRSALPHLEQALLDQAQERYIAQEKKTPNPA